MEGHARLLPTSRVKVCLEILLAVTILLSVCKVAAKDAANDSNLSGIGGKITTGTLLPNTRTGTLTFGNIAGTATASAPVVENLSTIVVFDGDSLTRGYMGSGDNTAHAVRLQVTLDGLAPAAVGYNTGVGGQTITQMQARLSTNAGLRYQPGKINVLVVQGGHNDIGASGATATQVFSAWQSYFATAKKLHPGWRIVLETQLPAANPGTYPATFDNTRNEANGLLRANWKALGACQLADVAADAAIGNDGQEYDGKYFNADRTHPTDAGYIRMGMVDLQAVRAAVLGCGISRR